MSRSPVDQPTDNAMPADYAESFLALRHMLRQGSGWSGHEKNCVFLNTGGPRFANVSATSGLHFDDDARAVALVDWDWDGDLDLWLSNRTGPRARFMRNDLPAGAGFVALRLEGRQCNRDAVGARVELHAGGRRQLRTLHAGQGFLGQSSKWLHFGLGRAAGIDRVVVRWPDGSRQELLGIEPGRFYRVVQGTAEARVWQPPPGPVSLQASAPAPAPRRDGVRVVLASPVPAPAVAFRRFDGTRQEIDFAGKMTLVNLWATWCAPCRQELGQLGAHAQALGATGLQVVALSLDGLGADRSGSPEKARQLLDELQFPFDSGMAEAATVNQVELVHGALIHTLRPFPIPSSLLVDPEGWVVALYQGAVDVEQLLRDVQSQRRQGASRRDLAVPFPGRWVSPPEFFDYLNAMGLEYLDAGYPEFAATHYRKLLQKHGDNAQWLTYLATVRSQQGRVSEAIEPLRQAVRLAPEHPEPARMLAWLLATSASSTAAEIDEALHLAQAANHLTQSQDAPTLDALAAAQARAGRFDAAVRTAGQAMSLAAAAGQEFLVQEIQRRQALYAQRQAYVAVPQRSVP